MSATNRLASERSVAVVAKERTVRCTNHCRACGGEEGRHFHSTAAFDAHRTGDFGSTDPETRRRCLHPTEVLSRSGEQRLVPLTTTGVCAVDVTEHPGVTVWTLKDGLEQARARWAA